MFLVLEDGNCISLRERERCRFLFFFCCPCPLAIGTSLLQTSVSVKVTAESAHSLTVGELLGGNTSSGTLRKASVSVAVRGDLLVVGSDIESFDDISLVAISISSSLAEWLRIHSCLSAAEALILFVASGWIILVINSSADKDMSISGGNSLVLDDNWLEGALRSESDAVLESSSEKSESVSKLKVDVDGGAPTSMTYKVTPKE
mmetsp:Transcript_16647/g.25885  ORF Transcript_16647/g.25885 Transcript_16647/m.25885 type:complete len:204 (-) Transcript_16647:1036-1647(-)